MTRQRILDEIKRTAKANGGKPLGKERFLRETGIKQSDWLGKHWARWGDALKEAGFAPNELQSAFDEQQVIGRFVGLIRELGTFPVEGEIRLNRHRDPDFPSICEGTQGRRSRASG